MVGRKPLPPATALSVALQNRRGTSTQREAAKVMGVHHATLARIERGTHRPSADTAVALAKWLGWSVEAVLEAAKTPVERA